MSASGYLERCFDRERKARIIAEALLEDKTRDLYLTNEKLKKQYHLAVQRQEELLEYQKLLREQVTHDALTTLPNRILFSDRLEQAIAEAHRHKKELAVIFIDLDNFKNINDTLGHAAGDELLILVSKRLKDSLRSSDTLARLSGDEFVIVITNQNNLNTIKVVLKKILAAIAKPFIIENQACNISCSLGISVYPRDGYDPETLLKNADAAMYYSKEIGKNTFQFFSDLENK